MEEVVEHCFACGMTRMRTIIEVFKSMAFGVIPYRPADEIVAYVDTSHSWPCVSTGNDADINR